MWIATRLGKMWIATRLGKIGIAVRLGKNADCSEARQGCGLQRG